MEHLTLKEIIRETVQEVLREKCGAVYACEVAPLFRCRVSRGHWGDHTTGNGASWPERSCTPLEWKCECGNIFANDGSRVLTRSLKHACTERMPFTFARARLELLDRGYRTR